MLIREYLGLADKVEASVAMSADILNGYSRTQVSRRHIPPDRLLPTTDLAKQSARQRGRCRTNNFNADGLMVALAGVSFFPFTP